MPISYAVFCLKKKNAGFYLHSVFFCIFIRLIFLCESFHVLTLLSVSFFKVFACTMMFVTWRYHRLVIQVFFVHDVTDIVLEFTKCYVYMKRRNCNFYMMNEIISNV